MASTVRILPRLATATRTVCRHPTSQLLRPTSSYFSNSSQPSIPRSRYLSSSSCFSAELNPPESPAEDSGSKPFLGTTRRLPEFNLSDRVILVTGAARGVGLALSEALLEAGAKVYALDRLPPSEQSPDFSRIQKTAETELGTSLHYRQIDVRDNAGLNKVIQEIADQEGRMDGLIASAGIQQETPAIDYTQEDANRMFETNITGVFMAAQAVARQMIRFGSGGSITLIASMSGTVVNRGLPCAAYNTSKAGVLQLARSLAAEWGPEKIRVNTISPGYIVTAMVEDLFVKYPDRKESWPTQNMLGRLSYTKDYRAAAVFLMGEGSSFMTGADLRIDGGHCAW